MEQEGDIEAFKRLRDQEECLEMDEKKYLVNQPKKGEFVKGDKVIDVQSLELLVVTDNLSTQYVCSDGTGERFYKKSDKYLRSRK